jgi:hypothetical protein
VKAFTAVSAHLLIWFDSADGEPVLFSGYSKRLSAGRASLRQAYLVQLQQLGMSYQAALD